MKKAFLTFALFIGVLAFGQETTKNIKEDVGIYKATVHHDNGQVAQTGFITKDKKVHGVWKSFDTNGNLKSLGEYNNGKKVGTWIFWETSIENKFDYTRVDYDENSAVAGVYKSDLNTQVALSETDEE